MASPFHTAARMSMSPTAIISRTRGTLMGIGAGIHRIMVAVHFTTAIIIAVDMHPDDIIEVIAREEDAAGRMVAGIAE